MSVSPHRSGSVPPPVNAANPVAAHYAASLRDTGEAVEAEPGSARRDSRTLSQALVPLAGLYFLITGFWGVVNHLQHLPRVTSTPHISGTTNTASDSWTVASGGFGVWWAISALIALAALYAGFRILSSDPRGWGVGILLALAGVAGTFLEFSIGFTTLGLAMAAANLGILWILVASGGPGRR